MVTELRNMESLKLVEDITKYVQDTFSTVDKSRMLSRLVDNEDLDPWMTFELMEAALRNLTSFDGVVLKDNMCRNRQSSTTAAKLNLVGSEADKYYNFQSIRVDTTRGAATIRHQNRPDGMFNLKLGEDNEMVIFYEGDAHDRDIGKSETKGCKNAHKMYQYMIQAQSLNKRSSGCAVFAAMNDSPTDEVGEFIEDMFKAHMFAGMLIIQHNMYQRNTARTILEDLLELDTKKKYDFVIGINIKSLPTNETFSETNFEGRVTNLLTALNKQNDVTVELEFQLTRPDLLRTYDCTVGCINITCFAVPRGPDTLLTRAYLEPLFVYPMHLSHVTAWYGDDGTMNTVLTNFHSPVSVRATLGNANMNLRFKKHMMNVTCVETAPNAATSKGNKCALRETDGFFYLALPLAYFTVEQFECLVNRRLDYKWASKRYVVKKMVYELMVSIKGVSTLPVRVEMFKENENSLLQQICRSTDDHNPHITDEFQGFLTDCCKWEACSAYASPAIFFRTLGIFSLQNAIDFACEAKNNQSATYTTLLSTYPVGTQIVIKQCMKKLSTNEAYGYLRREKITVKTDESKEQGPSDQSDDEPPPPPGTVLGAIQGLLAPTATTWFVTHQNSTDPEYQTWSDLQVKQATRGKRILQQELMKKYKKSVELWNVKKEKFEGVDEQTPDRDDNSILLIALGVQYIDFTNPDATLRAPGVDFGGKTYKYKTQLRVEIYNDEDDDEYNLYCKPTWPDKMTLEILRTQHQKNLRDGVKIYAIFDKETILCFEYRDTSLISSIFSPKHDVGYGPSRRKSHEAKSQGDKSPAAKEDSSVAPPDPEKEELYGPSRKKSEGDKSPASAAEKSGQDPQRKKAEGGSRNVRFTEDTRQKFSLDTPPLSDTNDVYL